MANPAFAALSAAYRANKPEDALPVDEAGLAEFAEQGRKAWSGFDVDGVALGRALGDLLSTGVAPDRVDMKELWLALGCAAGDSAAHRAFEETYFADAGRNLAHMRLTPDTQAEALQVARRRLLVSADGGPPKILGYAGRSQIRTLVRVVATRAALDLLRGQGRRREVPDADLSAVLLASASPESMVAHGKKAEVFRVAFEAAVGDLEAADRTLLRLYVVDGVGLDGLAMALGIHRSTAARRLARIRKTIEASTRARLSAGGIEGSQLDSVIGVVDAGLDLTLSRILSEPGAPESGGGEADPTDEQ